MIIFMNLKWIYVPSMTAASKFKQMLVPSMVIATSLRWICVSSMIAASRVFNYSVNLFCSFLSRGRKGTEVELCSRSSSLLLWSVSLLKAWNCDVIFVPSTYRQRSFSGHPATHRYPRFSVVDRFWVASAGLSTSLLPIALRSRATKTPVAFLSGF